MTPHAHHDEMSFEEHEKEHQEAESFLDWMKLAFHSDMGEGHLENFISADIELIDIDQVSQQPHSSFVFLEEIVFDLRSCNTAEFVNTPRRYIICDIGLPEFLRGPPLV